MTKRITEEEIRRQKAIEEHRAELDRAQQANEESERRRLERQTKAKAFVARWRDVTEKERSEAQTFWNELFHVLGMDRLRSGALFEANNPRASTGGTGFADLYLPGVILVEHKSRGRDLDKAMEQALDYDLGDIEPPRLYVACDFGNFYVRDTQTGWDGKFTLEELPRELMVFAPLFEEEMRAARDAPRELDLRAVEAMTDLYEQLRATHALDERAIGILLTRLLFCFFADDSEVWRSGLLDEFLASHDRNLNLLFTVLNTPQDDPRRQGWAGTLYSQFPYVNGGLFAERLDDFLLQPGQWDAIADASANNDWSKVSPAVFGSMFQGVMKSDDRHERGAHYTSETNIRRVIDPLFLDTLYQRTEDATTVEQLDTLWSELATLRFLDPACGCGNFLVVAYQELRALERHLMERMRELSAASPKRARYEKTYPWLGGHRILVGRFTKMSIDNFYGIEIDPWPAQIAQVSMWLTDHLANLALEDEFGGEQTQIPIRDTAHIVVGSALTLDWNNVLPATDCSFVMGNPPFLGTTWMSKEQKADAKFVWGKTPRSGDLDFVACWYRKAADYVLPTTDTHIAFVSTNSIAQGTQPPTLWGYLHDRGYHIDFAYRPFKWRNEARGNAAVSVVIIGFSRHSRTASRTLYTVQENETVCLETPCINAYLLPMNELLVTARRTPLRASTPEMLNGSKPTDGGSLSKIDSAAAELIRNNDPIAAKYLRPLLGAEELLNGKERWCLWLDGASPSDLANSPVLRKKTAEVREFRRASSKATTRADAATPHLFQERRQPTSDYLAVPSVCSETRSYIPIAFTDGGNIALNKIFTLETDSKYDFGLLMSSCFNTWNRSFSGRLEDRYSVSAVITYNTFPFPESYTDAQRERVEVAAQAVLEARAKYPEETLATLYGTGMPAELAKAHRGLDKAVIDAYGWKPESTPKGTSEDDDYEMSLLVCLVREYRRQLELNG